MSFRGVFMLAFYGRQAGKRSDPTLSSVLLRLEDKRCRYLATNLAVDLAINLATKKRSKEKKRVGQRMFNLGRTVPFS